MAEKKKPTLPTKSVNEEVLAHFRMARTDNDARKSGWEKSTKLYRSHIDESDWPFQSMVFDPRIFTITTEKSARLLGGKPRGKVFPREGGDVGKSRIINELKDQRWDNARHDGTMLEKWTLMDQRTRLYGASFGLSRWWYESKIIDKKKKTIFDAPEFIPLKPENALPDPNATSMENCHWFQVMSYPTLEELERVNDIARKDPVYDPEGLESIREAIERQMASASRTQEFSNVHRTISGLTDQSALDPAYKIIRIVTEYRPDRWITFAVDYKTILRDIPTPYNHYEIPIVMLRYLPTGYDIYGLAEVEPLEKLQKAINALICQYLDNAQLDLYPPLIVNPIGVQNYLTLEWAPGATWLASNPQRDIQRLPPTSGATTTVFTNTYSFLVAALLEAAGETTEGISSLRPFQPGKTATEVQSIAIERNVRDNYNALFLAEALGKLARLWFLMDKQFIKKPEVIRIVSRDALATFGKEPFANFQNVPVKMVGEETIPKLRMEEDMAFLAVEPEDLDGDYDFIYDHESFILPREAERREAQRLAIELLVNNPNIQALLQAEGFRPKIKDLLVELLQGVGLKEADRFFSAVAEMGGVVPPGPIPGGLGGQGFAIPEGGEGGPAPAAPAAPEGGGTV